MSDLQSLLKARYELQVQITALQTAEKASAVAKIRELMTSYGLTAADLVKGSTRFPTASNGSGVKVAAKYRDLSTGQVWAGRGLKPKWLQAHISGGRRIEEFIVSTA